MSRTDSRRATPPNTTIRINKRYIVDEQGNPREVIISYADFLKIGEILGLDLDDEAVNDLRQAQADRKSGRKDQYVELDDI
jgi:hypothetical protein